MADTVYNSTGGTNTATPTDPTKKKNLNLPYMQTGQNQVMPLASTAVNAGANAQGQPTGQLAPMQPLNQQQMIQNTYQQATQQKQDPLQGLIGNTYAQQIQNYGQNAQQNLQNTLENYDVQKAKAFEAAKQANANYADSGIFANELLQNQLQNLRDRGNLEQQTKTTNLENLNKVLSGAQASATQATSAQDQFMKNLIAATQAGEGEANRQTTTQENAMNRANEILLKNMDTEGQRALAILNGEIQSTAQDKQLAHETVQAALERASKIALQKGDIEGQKEIETLKGQIVASESALDRANAILLKNMDVEGQKEITTLQDKLQTGQLLKQQDFTAAQAALGRAHDLAVQNGDIQGQMQIRKLQGEIEAQAQKAQQTWQTGERVASQVFTSTERISTQDYDAGQKYLDRENQKSMQMQDYYNNLDMQAKGFNQEQTMAKINSDLEEAKAGNDYLRTEKLTKLQSALQAGLQDDAQIAAKELAQLEISNQQYLADKNEQLQLYMQLQGFGQEQQMAYLNSQLEDAKANKDVDRQKQILQYQTNLDLQKMGTQASYEEKMAYIKNGMDIALQNNDALHAEVLQKARLDQEAEQFTEEMVLRRAAQALEAKQVDMQQIEADYNKIVDMFGEDSEAAHEFVVKTLNANGVDTSGSQFNYVDATEQAKKALNAEFELQKNQFVQTHPEYELKANNSGGAPYTYEQFRQIFNTFPEETVKELWNNTETVGVTPEGQKKMNEFINSTMYGELTEEQKAEKEIAGYLKPEDLPAAQSGQKFVFDAETKLPNTNDGVNGEIAWGTVPPGKYTVTTEKSSGGSKFWGTKRDTTTYVLVGEDGKRYPFKTETSGTKGNIISGLWADE